MENRAFDSYSEAAKAKIAAEQCKRWLAFGNGGHDDPASLASTLLEPHDALDTGLGDFEFELLEELADEIKKFRV
jgi:hypothetical protein